MNTQEGCASPIRSESEKCVNLCVLSSVDAISPDVPWSAASNSSTISQRSSSWRTSHVRGSTRNTAPTAAGCDEERRSDTDSKSKMPEEVALSARNRTISLLLFLSEAERFHQQQRMIPTSAMSASRRALCRQPLNSAQATDNYSHAIVVHHHPERAVLIQLEQYLIDFMLDDNTPEMFMESKWILHRLCLWDTSRPWEPFCLPRGRPPPDGREEIVRSLKEAKKLFIDE